MTHGEEKAIDAFISTTNAGRNSILRKERADAHRNARGEIARPDLDKFACEYHWQRPDGSIYIVDSGD